MKTHITTVETLMLLFYYKCFFAHLSVHPSIHGLIHVTYPFFSD